MFRLQSFNREAVPWTVFLSELLSWPSSPSSAVQLAAADITSRDLVVVSPRAISVEISLFTKPMAMALPIGANTVFALNHVHSALRTAPRLATFTKCRAEILVCKLVCIL